MKIYEAWQKFTESLPEDQAAAFWGGYYEAETENYKKILNDKTFILTGTAGELAASFNMEPMMFAAFIDGANTSLKTPVALDTLEETTVITMEFLPETLYYNMLTAKAKWLSGLKEWDGVLSEHQRRDITFKWREDHTAKSTKVGRNDPCPCGSGKKYKNCCGV